MAGTGMDVDHEQTIGEAASLTQLEEDDLDLVKAAPDGGWGWIVLVGCFIINFISDGCSYSFGVLYTELLSYFGETKSKTSWVGSLFFSVPLLCGPLASVITTRVGCRNATIVGGVIAFLGFLTSSYVQSVEMLYFTYGIVAGFGMSLPYLTSILIISHYFKKRLAFATGVAECGAGIGTIVFAPLTEALLATYNWRGTMYILAAIAGNIIVCGALFRPVAPRVRTWKVSDSSIAMNDLTKSFEGNKNTEEDFGTRDSMGNHTIKTIGENGAKVIRHENENNVQIETGTPLETDSLCNVEESVGNNSTGTFNGRNSRNGKPKCRACCHKHSTSLISSMKLSIFKHPIFLLFAVSNFILYFWFDTPFVYLANRAVESKMSESRAALLVSVIGVLHTLGNLLFGLAGDVQQLSLPLMYGVSIAVCGASLLAVPSFTTFLPLSIIAGMFGLFSAASEALSSILLIDILGQESLSQSYGFTMLLKGIANLVGPPVAGFLFDESGSYDNTFYGAGTCLIVAGLMYVPTPWLRRVRCAQCVGQQEERGTRETRQTGGTMT